MVSDESTSFDPVAPFYDESSGPEFSAQAIRATVDLLAELAGSGRVLELGIGTGRIALPLAARGISVTGIDASQGMVEQLRAKPGGADIPVVIGDFGEALPEGPFSLAYVVYNTLSNLLTQEKQVACFENVAAQLEPGGRFLVEIFVPKLERIGPENRIDVFDHDDGALGFDVVDVFRQRLTSHHYRFGGERSGHFASEHRYVWPAELDLMARVAGLRLLDRWGGWTREPFTETSTFHVSVYEKPAV
jgi:SAM-dependent methyltransferase